MLTTGITAAEAGGTNAPASVSYYNLKGISIDKPARGAYIRVETDGKGNRTARKVVAD